MIRHLVLLRWKENTPEHAVAAVDQAFAELRQQVPQIKQLSYGADAGIYRGNADYVLIADFASEADLRSYVNHPAHQALLEKVTGPLLASWSSAQIELP